MEKKEEVFAFALKTLFLFQKLDHQSAVTV